MDNSSKLQETKEESIEEPIKAIGCSHYKRKSKFVVSSLVKYLLVNIRQFHGQNMQQIV